MLFRSNSLFSEYLKTVPDLLETLMSEKRLLQGSILLVRSLKIINNADMHEIGAVADLRSYLETQEAVRFFLFRHGTYIDGCDRRCETFSLTSYKAIYISSPSGVNHDGLLIYLASRTVSIHQLLAHICCSTYVVVKSLKSNLRPMEKKQRKSSWRQIHPL